jgi:hypothetical protein
MTVTFAWEVHPDRLNLGCGYDRRDGYTNVDLGAFHEPDLVADIRELGMLPSGHYREILAYDCLEHLPRTDTDRALTEWFRLLAPGGVIRLQVPNFAGIARQMAAAATVAEQKAVIHQLFGTQAYTGDFHQTTFTDLTLLDHLGAVGFADACLENRDGWLFEAEARKPVDPAVPRVGVSWRPGFHRLEGGPDSGWRWCAAEGEILLFNAMPGPVRVRIEARAEAPGSRRATLRVEAAGARAGDHRLGREPVAVGLALVLPPGGTVVRLSSDAHRVEAATDPRDLRFRLIDVRLEASPA